MTSLVPIGYLDRIRDRACKQRVIVTPLSFLLPSPLSLLPHLLSPSFPLSPHLLSPSYSHLSPLPPSIIPSQSLTSLYTHTKQCVCHTSPLEFTISSSEENPCEQRLQDAPLNCIMELESKETKCQRTLVDIHPHPHTCTLYSIQTSGCLFLT